MEIRPAREDDLQIVMDYGEPFWKQTEFYKNYGITYDRVTVEKVLRACMADGVALMVDNGGQIDGFILVLVHPSLQNETFLLATEYAFYVSPRLRGKEIGKKLIQSAEKMLSELGVTMFTMVSMTEVTPDTANDLYMRLDFKHTETGFSKEIL